MNIFLDPVMGQVDFGAPLLYTGNKRILRTQQEIDNYLRQAAFRADTVLISQGFDDHAHLPTLQRLTRLRPSLNYIAPPSALSVLQKAGISINKHVRTLLPGQSCIVTATDGLGQVQIDATSGALLGPPWQQKENGYIITAIAGVDLKGGSERRPPSVYYEPHCNYDEGELRRRGCQADVVITPVVAQELPAYTLISGGNAAARLATVLKAKVVVPMRNGELIQSGLLANILKTRGSEDEFKQLLSSSESTAHIRMLPAPAGELVSISL